jgi:4-carboxymuconolactone decarboxylase
MKVKQFVMIASLMLTLCGSGSAEDTMQVVQLARLEIDPAQLDAYKAALKEEVETALRVEPGVLSLYATAEKENPTHITLVEVYADEEAYKAHLQTPHFLKYKTGTKDMVKSLELVRMLPLFPGLKAK